MLAALVGAAVIVAQGGPSPGRGPGWRPPAYERALRWRDIVRLRLSPWLLSPWLLSRSQEPPGSLGDLPELPRARRWPRA